MILKIAIMSLLLVSCAIVPDIDVDEFSLKKEIIEMFIVSHPVSEIA